MPGVAIPRSNSDPFLSASASSSKTRFHPSNRSTCSSSRTSSKSVYWLAWSNVDKLGSLFSFGRKGIESSSKDSDLTEESLRDHNRRQQEAFDNNVDDKNAKCSPYYKGLTDYSLIINREKHHYLPQNHQPSTSPGRESHATTVATSNSISSFMLVKMQEWSSCFKSSTKDNQHDDSAPAPVLIQVHVPALISAPPPLPSHDSPVPVPCFTPPAPSGGSTITMEQGHPCGSNTSSLSFEPSTTRMPMKRKESDIDEEKPLRERVSTETKSPPPPGRSEVGASNVDEKNEIDMLDANKFTWADRYRPKSLKDFICNRSTAAEVQGLVRGIDCNHFIFEGPPGVGKRTMIWAMIQEAFGPDGVEAREECKAFNLKGESIGSINVRIKVYSQHIEVNLSDVKGYEKHVIVELIKETDDRNSKNRSSKTDTCRAIIVYNADKLSADSVLYIKWLLERYKGSSKFFFCCTDVSKLQPIKELCTFVQLFLPSNEEIVEVLELIAKQEGIELPRKFAQRIAADSKNNLRQAIRSLEASWQRSYPFTEDQEILTGWEDDIANISKDMIQEQSPKQLYIIRGKLQNLIEHDVSPAFILNTLVNDLKKHLDDFCQGQLDNLYKDYNRFDGKMTEGENQMLTPFGRHDEVSKRNHDLAKKKFNQFMNIEEFIAKFMSLYKLHITTSKSMQHDSGI